MDNKNIVSLGIDFNAENFYNSKDSTYEPEGVKKPIDNVQLADSYIKLINDHPLLSYLEQPMAYEDIDGWGTLLEKLKDKPNIFDVCGWYFHNRSFDDQFTADDLVDLFFKEIKLTRDETANWFNFDIFF